MQILKTKNGETRCTITFPRSKKENYLELIFTYEDDQEVKTANIRIGTDQIRQFLRELHEQTFLKEVNDIL